MLDTASPRLRRLRLDVRAANQRLQQRLRSLVGEFGHALQEPIVELGRRVGHVGGELSASPGRIDPTNPAFGSSRKPLAAEFLFHGHHLFVIGNHLNSKGGDQPLFGHLQPPARGSEVQRHQQAQVIRDFVATILAADPAAGVVVDGDLNDFEFSDTVGILESAGLHDLLDTLPQSERYSFVFEGNSQSLDHILVSGALAARPNALDVVHVNPEFADQASDHDPSVVRVTLDDPPSAAAGGPYVVDEGGSVARGRGRRRPGGRPGQLRLGPRP